MAHSSPRGQTAALQALNGGSFDDCFNVQRYGLGRDVAAAPQTPQLGGGAVQLWGPKLV